MTKRYTPTDWQNEIKDTDGTVVQKGTPLSAENLNKIENELERLSPAIDEIELAKGSLQQQSNDIDSLGTKIQSVQDSAGQPNGIATLGANGIVPASQLPSQIREMRVVTDIAARDALDKFEGLRVLVLDATADVTVKTGWAEYVYDGLTFIKVTEGEQLDVVLNWDDITGKPTTFKPSEHGHSIEQITNLLEVLNSKETPEGANAKVDAHAGLKNNPHAVTTQQVNYLGTYARNVNDDHTKYPLGISVMFVGPSEQFGNWGFYGTVTTYKSYPAGGGTFQTFCPYGEPGASLGAGIYRVRYYQYSVYEWTPWKEFETTDGANTKVNSHAADDVLHISTAERKAWNEKSNFSGSYTDLTNKPSQFPPSAHTHDYNTLTNKPTIPDRTSELTNDSGFVQSNAGKITVSATAPINPKPNDIWIVI